MTFNELVAGVLEWTKRPDLDTSTRSAIRALTLKYHRRHKFFKDLVAIPVANPTLNLPVAVIPLSSFPQLRQFASLGITGGCKLHPMEVDDDFDRNGYARQNVYLIAGTNLNIKASLGFVSIDAVYYRDPIPTEIGYDSWIAIEQPDLIIAGAAARVLAFDNESEIFKAAKQEEAEQWATFVSSNLEPEGR